MGRPSSFTDEIADRICELTVIEKPMDDICALDGMPTHQTVTAWLRRGEAGEEPFASFLSDLAQARTRRDDKTLDECLKIADASQDDLKPDENGVVATIDHIQRAKLRIETRMKILAIRQPKKYGTRITSELTGENGGPIATTTSLDLSTLSVEQLTALSGIASSLNPAAREPDCD